MKTFFFVILAFLSLLLTLNNAANANISEGLVAHWKMDEANWSGTANEVRDSSGNAHHGTAHGGATPVAGKIGNTASLDGVNDWIEFPDHTDFHVQNFSISAWVKPSSLSPGFSTIFTKDDWNVGYQLLLGEDSSVKLFIAGNGQWQTNCSKTLSPNLLLNRWTHLVGTCDEKNLKIYMDGQLIADVPRAMAMSAYGSKSLFIGRNVHNPVYLWNGGIDEVRIYNRALSVDEIQQLYGGASDAPTISIMSPSSPVTLNLGESKEFNIEATAGSGIKAIEWYVGSTSKKYTDYTGSWVYYKQEFWSTSFSSAGTYYVHAYVYDREAIQREAMVTWEVIVGKIEPVEEQFFDDFSYSSPTDPKLDIMGWSITNGKSGPPEGASYSRDNIAFRDENGNRIMSLSASNCGEFSSMSQSHIGTSERIFLEGTYVAKVRFTDTPKHYQDGSVQTFYSITPLSEDNDPLYSECDFEYLPYPPKRWSGSDDHSSRLYYTTWETYTPEPWYANKKTTETKESHEGWHILMFKVIDGSVVRYWVDGNLVAEHEYSDKEGDTVYPESPMSIDFNHWFFTNADNDGLGPITEDSRTYTYEVDWVYHAKDRDITTSTVLELIDEFQQAGVERCNTMPGFNIPCSSEITECAECTNDPVILQNVTFSAGTNCECISSTYITIDSGVIVKNGATVIFRAPKVTVKNGVSFENGSVVRIK